MLMKDTQESKCIDLLVLGNIHTLTDSLVSQERITHIRYQHERNQIEMFG
jgi:hypothetical protein|nr:hypothetical protein Q903MT_gene5896 [Picea sitchensis]